MPIYTHQGDSGETSLINRERVSKDDVRLDICGNIDELSASLGVVRAEGLPQEIESILVRIQQEFISFCTEIISGQRLISPEHIRQMESEIDHIESELLPLTHFILAGSNRVSALLHHSRTICRRAERSLVTFLRQSQHLPQQPSPHLIPYLNRLSDLLFVWARKVS